MVRIASLARRRAVLVAAGMCVAFPLRAAEPPIALQWNAPEGAQCPTEADVVAQVTQLVDSWGSSERASARARADVTRLGEALFRVELSTDVGGRAGHRIVEERSCKAMAEATVLILAWTVDPSGDPSSAPVTEAPSPPDTPAPTAAHRPRWHPTIGAEFVADRGTLPSFAVGAAVNVGVRHGALQLMARGALFNTVDGRLTDTAGASFSLSTASVHVCASPMPSEAAPWSIAACAGPELDRIVATGSGVDAPRSATVTWLSGALAAEVRARLAGPLDMTASLGIIVPTRREDFGLDGLGIVHRPAALSGRAGLALRYVF
jgi:hypothetical protein